MNKWYYIVCLLIITGCTSTDMTSVRDRGYLNKKYARILIIVNHEDLGIVKNIENEYQIEFQKRNIPILIGTMIVPPTKEYTDEELNDIVSKNNIDAILTIGIRGAGSASDFVHLKTKPATSTTTRSVSWFGNQANYNEKTTYKAAEEKGFVITKSWIKFLAKLYDASTREVAWMATSTSEGTNTNDYSLINSQAGKTVEKLIGDGVVIDQEKIFNGLVSSANHSGMYKLGYSNYLDLISDKTEKIFDETVLVAYFKERYTLSFKGIFGINKTLFGFYKDTSIMDLRENDSFYIKMNDNSIYQFEVFRLSDKKMTLKYTKQQ